MEHSQCCGEYRVDARMLIRGLIFSFPVVVPWYVLRKMCGLLSLVVGVRADQC